MNECSINFIYNEKSFKVYLGKLTLDVHTEGKEKHVKCEVTSHVNKDVAYWRLVTSHSFSK